MPRNLTFDLLRAFAVVAETQHFSRAAERLGCAQSAVSTKIRQLEQLVGTRLFHRTKRVVQLTPEGETFIGHANRLLRLSEEAMSVFGQFSPRGQVRLGATDTSMCLLPPVLSRFAQDFPLMELEIYCDRSWEALDALEAGDIDIALVTQPCGRKGGQVVRREPLVWVAAAGSVVDELEPLPLAIFAPGCIYRAAALEALEEVGRSYRHAYNSASRDGLDTAVSAGLALSFVPACAVKPGWRILGPEKQLPCLPAIEFLMYVESRECATPVQTFATILADELGESNTLKHARKFN